MKAEPGRLRRWLRRRAIPVTSLVVSVVGGMQLSFWWYSWSKGAGYVGVWRTPGDFWDTYLSSVNLVHGHISQIYSPATILVAFPGITFALAPVAAFTSAVHWPLGPPQTPFWATKAWLVAGPWMIILSSIVVFGADRFAERWGWSTLKRSVLAIGETLILVNVTVWWGHPEDAIAVGLVLYAALAAEDERWRRLALLLGLAVAMQPLALLAAAPLLARLAWRQIGRLLPWLVGPTLVVLGGPLVAEPRAVWRVLFNQPNYPLLNHVTPWTSTATKLSAESVAAGPWRLVAVVIAMALGAAVCRRRQSLDLALWVVAASFVVRLCFETVIANYYIWPALAVGMLVAGRRGWPRFVGFVVFSMLESLFQQVHMAGVWPWWSLTVVPMVAALVIVFPVDALALRAPSAAAAETGTRGRSPRDPADLRGSPLVT